MTRPITGFDRNGMKPGSNEATCTRSSAIRGPRILRYTDTGHWREVALERGLKARLVA